MSQSLASTEFAEIASPELARVDFAFIDGVEYEFVGGGTAVNNL